jgi:hypothetical protein
LELSSEEEDEESIDSEEIQQLCNANAKWNEAQEWDIEVGGQGPHQGLMQPKFQSPMKCIRMSTMRQYKRMEQ